MFQKLVLLTTDETIQSYCVAALKPFFKEIVHSDASGIASLIIADLLCLNREGFDYFQKLIIQNPQVPIVVISRSTHPCLVQKALSDGAVAFIEFPCSESRFVRTILNLSLPSYSEEAVTSELNTLLGNSAPMLEVKQKIIRAAQQDDLPILLLGESGTGKSFAAKLLAQISGRNKNSFFEVNVTSFNETIIESELFGTSLGAFTGSIDKPGFFEKAQKGTLFLDEIGDLPAAIQVKLLHVIESGSFFKVGSTANLRTDVKLIFATNANLSLLRKTKQIRDDFFFRIMQFPIKIPSLKERIEDIPLLAHAFAAEKKKYFSAGAMEKLLSHKWLGNVRELSNCIKYACLLCSKNKIDASDIVFVDADFL